MTFDLVEHEDEIAMSPTCFGCRHFFPERDRACAAFPDGIPIAIWSGESDHRTPVIGDHDFQCEPLTAGDFGALEQWLVRQEEDGNRRAHHYRDRARSVPSPVTKETRATA